MNLDGMQRNLSYMISEQMGRDILTGVLPVGYRFVADDIQKRYGVSRTAVREALVTLTTKGLLTSKPNVGIRISPSDHWHLLDPDVMAWAPLDGWLAASARALYTRLLADVPTAESYVAGEPLVKQLLEQLARFAPRAEDTPAGELVAP